MRITRLALLLACAAALAFAGNALLTFALEPIASNSEVTWAEYEKLESLDTLVIGSSHVQQDVDPRVLDEELGWETENMGVPSQTLPETLAAIQTAHRDHGIERVILGLSPNTLLSPDPPDPGKAFLRWRAANVPLADTASTTAWLLFGKGAWTEPDSLNLLSPWVSNHVDLEWGKIRRNVKLKLAGTDLLEAVEQTQKTWRYVDRGYGARTYVLDYNGKRAIPYFQGAGGAGDGTAIDLSAGMSAESRESLAEICSFCDDNGIELVAIIPPFPAYDIIYCGEDYYALSDGIRSFIEENGGSFCDFNLARPELFDARPDYFADSEHLSVAGGEPFTRSLAKYLRALGSDEDTSAWFYTPEEHAQTLSYISTVFMDAVVEEGEVRLSAQAVASPSVRAEYRFSVKEDGEWKTLREWSGDPECSFTPGSHGTTAFRVDAREVGSDAPYERYREVTALY